MKVQFDESELREWLKSNFDLVGKVEDMMMARWIVENRDNLKTTIQVAAREIDSKSISSEPTALEALVREIASPVANFTAEAIVLTMFAGNYADGDPSDSPIGGKT